MSFLKLILLGGLLFFLLSCGSRNKLSVEDVMKEANISVLPTQDDFPNDGGVILYEKFNDRLYLDSDYNVRVEETVQRAILYFNDKAENWTDHVIYLDDQSFLSNFTAYTKKPNGEIVYLSEKDLHPTHINEDLQQVSHEKSLRFIFPAVEPGAILYYGYTIDRKGFFFGDYWFVESSLPKIYTKFVFEIPKLFFHYGYNWNYSAFNFVLDEPKTLENILTEKSEKDASLIFYWELREIPALKREPFSPPYYDVAKYVSVDLKYKNWNELAKIYYRLIKDYFNAYKLPEVKSLSEKICQNAKSTEEKIKRIFEYAQTEFRYLAFDIGESGIIPHAFSEIVKNKYGDCKDMTVLQVNLLRAQGIKAYPALVPTKARTLAKPSFISLKNFDHMLVYVQADSGKKYWLDATGDICPFGEIYPSIEGQHALVLFDKGKAKFVQIPSSTSDDNLIRRIVDLQIDPQQSIQGDVKILYEGNPNLSIRSRLREATDDDFQKYIKSYVNSHAGELKINDLKYDRPNEFKKEMNIEFHLSKEKYGSQLNDLLVLNPALFKLGSDLERLVDEKRKHTIFLGSPITIYDEVHLRFDPTKYKIEGLFETLSYITSFASFTCKVEQAEKGHLIFKRIYRLSNGLVNKSYYNDLKELEKNIAQAAEQNIALRKL